MGRSAAARSARHGGREGLVASLFAGVGAGGVGVPFTSVSLVLAVLVGAAHYYENVGYLRHLERLPDRGLAKVTALQTENAFYYSYYQELVFADSAVEGLQRIVWDQRSEYPDTLNALRRFNIYQEVVLALAYRMISAIGLGGLIDEWDFFRHSILVINTFGHSALALLTSEVSGNPFSGVFCFLLSFLNRFQISRLGNYTSSNLREIWGTPVLWMQTLCLLRLISSAHSGAAQKNLWRGFGCLTFIFIVLWQFSPFLLLLQATALYFVNLVCGFAQLRTLVLCAVNTYLVALALAVVVHFGSPYLLTSPFFFQLVGMKTALTLRSRLGVKSHFRRGCIEWLLGRIIDVVEGLVAVAVFFIVMKVAQPFATADTHVYEILCTKVTIVNDLLPEYLKLAEERMPTCAEPSFNARLYLIMGVFNVLEASSIEVYKSTTAGQFALLASIFVALRFLLSSCLSWYRSGRAPNAKRDANKAQPVTSTRVDASSASGLRKRKGEKEEHEPSAIAKQATSAPSTDRDRPDCVDESESCEEAALLFFVMQTLLFFLLGYLINRLRTAFGPPMMVLAASCFGPRLFPLRLLIRRQRGILIAVLILLHCVHMIWVVGKLPCVNEKEGICNHLSDKSNSEGDLADLADWINKKLHPSVPLLTSMNLGGSLRAFTDSALVIHPQFESAELRRRVQLGYELYHCGSETSFAESMRNLSAQVVIFETSRCFFTPYILDDKSKNCDNKIHVKEDQLCIKLYAHSRFFELLFMNGNYGVFRLRDVPLPGKSPTASEVKSLLAEPDIWGDYISRCEDNGYCGARLIEAAASWEKKQPAMGRILRGLAEKNYPDDPYVNYYVGRHLDYDKNQGQLAGRYYKKAMSLLPDNTVALKECLMWMDMVGKDTAGATRLLEDRKGTMHRNGQPKPLLLHEGPGSGILLCETAISAIQLGMNTYGKDMWRRALDLAPLSDCVKNNWPMADSANYSEVMTTWKKIQYLLSGKVNHDIQGHNSPAIRFVGDNSFLVNPHDKRKQGSR